MSKENDMELIITPELVNTAQGKKVKFFLSDGENFTESRGLAEHINDFYFGALTSGEIGFIDPDNLFQEEWNEIKVLVANLETEDDVIKEMLSEEY